MSSAAVVVDRHLEPRESFHLPGELREALVRYCESFRPELPKSAVMRVALEDFLRAKGFWNPSDD